MTVPVKRLNIATKKMTSSWMAIIGKVKNASMKPLDQTALAYMAYVIINSNSIDASAAISITS